MKDSPCDIALASGKFIGRPAGGFVALFDCGLPAGVECFDFMAAASIIETILASADAEHRTWLDMVERLSQADAEARPGGQWSALDMLLHVASWKENAMKAARLQAEPGAPTLEPDQGVAGTLGIDVDDFNEEFMATHRDRSREEALAWSAHVHAGLKEALVLVPPERLLGGTFEHGARRWYWRPAVVHPIEHRVELEARVGR
jgi:hypothetical protein